PDHYYYKGMARLRQGDQIGAIRDFDRAIRLDAEHVDAIHARGIARARLGDDTAAIADFDRAITLDVEWSLPLVARGLARWRLGWPEAALDDFDRAVTRELPDAAAYCHRARLKLALRGEEALEDALADLYQSDSIKRDDPLTHFCIGQLTFCLGNFS